MAYKIELISGLTEEIAHTLNMEGVKYTHHLLDRVRTPSQRRFLANHLGVEEKRLFWTFGEMRVPRAAGPSTETN